MNVFDKVVEPEFWTTDTSQTRVDSVELLSGAIHSICVVVDSVIWQSLSQTITLAFVLIEFSGVCCTIMPLC